MNMITEIARSGAKGVVVGQTAEELVQINMPGTAAAVWQRQPLPEFQSWIDGLSPEDLPKARVILHQSAVFDAVRKYCDISGTPDCAERELLIGDTAALAQIFSEQMGTEWLRVRLDVVRTNMCRKFHIDAVTARLICTYRGTGTQYGNGSPGEDPEQIFTVPTGSPLIIRGTCWPETPSSGLLHRSPPIEGTGETRLMFVLDPVKQPEQEPEFYH